MRVSRVWLCFVWVGVCVCVLVICCTRSGMRSGDSVTIHCHFYWDRFVINTQFSHILYIISYIMCVSFMYVCVCVPLSRVVSFLSLRVDHLHIIANTKLIVLYIIIVTYVILTTNKKGVFFITSDICVVCVCVWDWYLYTPRTHTQKLQSDAPHAHFSKGARARVTNELCHSLYL